MSKLSLIAILTLLPILCVITLYYAVTNPAWYLTLLAVFGGGMLIIEILLIRGFNVQ